MSNTFYQANRTDPIVQVERSPAPVSPRKLAADTYRPTGLDDLAWRTRYRLKRALYTVFGPAQLMPRNDPLTRLAREREQRYGTRTRPANPPR